ncbi:RarD protein [Haemophilus influenzae]|uniref:RarD protein n=1 Tax=Haemophilus influenzae TaxID=727 RepID=A0A2X1PW53_HAEIF|nr:RarD protein [Haemophilus influenzae]
MFKGILVSLLASFLFGYMYYFSTLLKPLSGTDIFGYRMIFTFPFVLLSVTLFKQKAALIERLKRIQKRPHLAFVIFTLRIINGLSNVAFSLGTE